MHIKRPWPLVAAAMVFLAVLAAPAIAPADNGNASTTLSFFSGGGGAHADWFVTADQPAGDTDKQAIRIVTTSQGYAGVLFHHVTGIPAAAFPDSDYWVKRPGLPDFTLGSPRLIVTFMTAAGVPSGDAELTPNVFSGDWQHVSDVSDPGNSGWDTHSAICPYGYHLTWTAAQLCHAGEFVSSVFITTDPYGYTYLVDDVTVNGKHFSSASDNGGGNNDPAGPEATTDPSLLPPLDFLP